MFKNQDEIKFNIEYCFAQGFYWMVYCCGLSMASAFLVGKGFSTAAVGVILAIVYLLGICIQQIVSIKVDSSRRISVVEVCLVLGISTFISLICSSKTNHAGFVSAVWFMLGAISITVLQPFLNALNFYIEKADVKMNYGLARGMGSLFFFFSSLIAGQLMNKISVNGAPAFGAVIMALYIIDICLILYGVKGKNIEKDVKEYDPFEGKQNLFSINDAKLFVQKYKMFFVFLLGVIGYYYGHMVVNNFLYQIGVNVGGDTADNGGLLAFQAIVELPCMFFFTQLRKKFGTKLLLGASGVFFLFKIIFTLVATNIPMLYFSMIFQSVSFALFLPGAVTLVNEIMDEQDAVKGQALVTVAMTISNLLASVISGFIISLAGVSVALWLGTIVTLLGAVISIFSLVRINQKK